MSDDQTVTVVTSRRVKPGCEAEFERWLEGIGAVAARYPGYVARHVTRPADHEHPEYVIVFRFTSYSTLRGWTESTERQAWLEKVKPFVLDDYRETALTGLEAWFTVPSKPGQAPPPRYKMAAVTLLVVYPLSMGLSSALLPWLDGVPGPARSLLTSVVMIVLMTWVLMPRATWLFRKWLFG